MTTDYHTSVALVAWAILAAFVLWFVWPGLSQWTGTKWRKLLKYLKTGRTGIL